MLQCIVLNTTYEPLNPPIPVREALLHIIYGRAELEEAHPEKKIRTVNTEYPVPLVIRLRAYVKVNRKYADDAKLNKHNLYVRDDYTCQYCGRHVSTFNDDECLTKDHIIPRDRGGRNTWENLVTACSTCNMRKANRTPKEARMDLLSKPHQPKQAKLAHKRKQWRK